METSSDEIDVVQNLQQVKTLMLDALKKAERGGQDVTLVAVSKFHEASRIRPVLEAGHRTFGENRVQEAQEKWPDLRADFPDVQLHLIGPLQTNKVKQAVATFDVIETVDREKLARALAREFEASGRALPVFLQINTGEEPQKAGVMPLEADDFIQLCRNDLGLNVQGLMCIPPAAEEPALHFALLSTIAARNGLKYLSMGMSGDFATALELGATHVRVGTAIFGQR